VTLSPSRPALLAAGSCDYPILDVPQYGREVAGRQGEFMDLKNASMVITGAGSGIGQALALRLAEPPRG